MFIAPGQRKLFDGDGGSGNDGDNADEEDGDDMMM